MFQSFDAQTQPDQGPPRLRALRAALADASLDGFLVPRADAHQGEYVAACDERLAWLTGFTGSAGFAVVLPDVAAVFVDGRYRVQVRQQVDPVFTPVNWPEVSLADWLKDQTAGPARIGYDPWLHTVQDIAVLRDSLDATGVTLVPRPSIIDTLWTDRPAPPAAPFSAYTLSGEAHAEKRARLADDLTVPSVFLSLPDSIAWLLNIRGADINRNPVPQAFAQLFNTGAVTLYAPAGKTEALKAHLGPDITIADPNHLLDDLANSDGPVGIDPKSCPQIIADTLGDRATHMADPCSLPKARKNQTELEGARAAHLRDGAAMVKFLAWLDEAAPSGALTEIDVVQKLESCRRETGQLLDISFDTICGSGPHGAIVHYRVTRDSNRPLSSGELLLIDSGGQYIDGTTDITRTICIGPAQPQHRHCYTRVLQGMIAISRTQFPRGISGQHLDALARAPLWADGLDYDHGTGHGVGAYLCVHEGPQGLSRRSQVPLDPGMILSNEPGYYREGAFGIRIENLVVVETAPIGPDARDMLQFETLTYVPLDRRLIDTDLLSPADRGWIDSYHATTLDRLAPMVDVYALDWLHKACAPL